MGLSDPRIIYGIHSICPYSRTDGLPYGILKVLGGGSLNFTAESEDLFGGSNKYAWASEAKTISSEFSVTVKSMPDFLFELFLGAEVSTTAASTSGTCGTLANKKGTSVLQASTGIASVGLKSGETANVKSGIYLIKAVSATTVDVYALSDIDFARGTDVAFENDALKITSSPLTVTSGADTAIPNIGIEINGGSGTIALVSGDTAVFAVAAPHGGISEITIGKQSSTFPEHGQLLVAQKRSNGDIFEIEIYKAVGQGFPIALEETVFAVPEMTAKVLYDSVKDKTATIRAIKGA
jgi:hypothetical protein